jgi:hypothetical protein
MPDHIARLNAALEGRYRIERELGRGGMATVYLADDLRHERKVALKVLKPELAAVVGAERFLAEIKTTANLQHPHILPLFDSGEADSFLFYVQLGDTTLMMSAEFTTSGSAFRRGRVTPLFTLGSEFSYSILDPFYDVGPDDQRFMLARTVAFDERNQGDFVLVQNFSEELKRLVPTNAPR